MTRRVAGGLWLQALSMAALAGCGSDGADPVQGLCGPALREACDVSDLGCQEKLFDYARCVNGAREVERPPVDVLGAEDFSARYLADSAASVPIDDRIDRARRWLGLIPADEEVGTPVPEVSRPAALAGGTGAHYSSRTGRIAVWEDMSAPDLNSILVHEYSHGIQDASVDLAEYLDAGGYDTWLGASAVVEGQATVAQMHAGIEVGLTYPPLTEIGEWAIPSLDITHASSRRPLVETADAFARAYGVELAADAWLAGGASAMWSMLEDRPTTADLMRHHSDLPPLEPAVIAAPPSPLYGYSVIHGPHALGAWIAFNVLSRVHAAEFAREQAVKLRGDQLTVYVGAADDGTAARWVFEWEDETAATALATWFEAQVADSPGALSLTVATTRTTIWAADTVEALERWSGLDR